MAAMQGGPWIRALQASTYAIANPPDPGTGGYSEAGISYQLTQAIDTLFWQRDAQWSAYPDDHIGRSRGVAAKTRPGPVGIIDVYIDGTRDATIDLYGPSKQPNQAEADLLLARAARKELT